MAKKKHPEVVLDCTNNALFVDGVRYAVKTGVKEKVDNVTHIRKLVYEPVSEEQVDKHLDKLTKTLIKQTDANELVRELIKDKMSVRQMAGMVNELDKGKPVKKHKGCLGFKVGRKYVQLIG